jgi:hypothetical protein
MLELVLVDTPSYTTYTHTWVRARTRLELPPWTLEPRTLELRPQPLEPKNLKSYLNLGP